MISYPYISNNSFVCLVSKIIDYKVETSKFHKIKSSNGKDLSLDPSKAFDRFFTKTFYIHSLFLLKEKKE